MDQKIVSAVHVSSTKKKNNMKENSHKLSIHLYKAFMGNK